MLCVTANMMLAAERMNISRQMLRNAGKLTLQLLAYTAGLAMLSLFIAGFHASDALAVFLAFAFFFVTVGTGAYAATLTVSILKLGIYWMPMAKKLEREQHLNLDHLRADQRTVLRRESRRIAAIGGILILLPIPFGGWGWLMFSIYACFVLGAALLFGMAGWQYYRKPDGFCVAYAVYIEQALKSQRCASEAADQSDEPSGFGAQYKSPHSADSHSQQGSDPKGEEQRQAAVLGLKGRVTPSDVKRAYRLMIAKYHPDKVSHLGPEFQEIAQKKTRSIVLAYEYFKSKYDIA